MLDGSHLGKLLIVIGLLIAGIGCVLLFAGKIPWLGRLPGDFFYRGKNVTFSFPLMTSLILSVNPAFKRFFSCTDTVLGRHISYLMDPAPFEKLVSGVTDTMDVTITHRHYNLMTRELLYILKEERQIVGIFINITSQREHETKLKEIRSQTIAQADELLEHQIKMAQTIAQFLGESTARGEELVRIPCQVVLHRQQ